MQHFAGLRTALTLSGLILLGDGASASQTIRYTYDAKGRLAKVEGDGANASTSIYSYDAADNRSNVKVAASPRILNESFENPAISSYVYTPNAADLKFSGGAGISRAGDAWGFPAPWQGSQVAFLQASDNQAGAVEMKAINLTPGRTYIIAFAAVQRPGYPSNAIQVFVDGTLKWNSAPNTSERFSAYSTQPFTATQTTAIIRFSATPTYYDSSSGLDAVSAQVVN